MAPSTEIRCGCGFRSTSEEGRAIPALMRGLILLSMLVPAVAFAEDVVVIMPVWGPSPPPQDPTFLRTTKALAEAIHGAAGREVQVYSRDKRGQVCADNGHQCPNEIATLLDVHQVVELTFDDKLEQLHVQVWGRPRGLLREAKIPCVWEEGRPVCPTEPVAQVVSGDALGELDHAAVEQALDGLQPKVQACLGKKKQKKRAQHEVDVTLRFRVAPNGRIKEVRIDPRELQTLPAWACVGRVVEALRVPPFRGDQAVPFSRVIGRAAVARAPE